MWVRVKGVGLEVTVRGRRLTMKMRWFQDTHDRKRNNNAPSAFPHGVASDPWLVPKVGIFSQLLYVAQKIHHEC